MPSQKVKGVQGNENKYCVWYQNRSLGTVVLELHTSPRARNNFGNRGCTGESGFDPVELWVMGPPCGLKVGRAKTSCVIMQARYVRGYPVSYVGNNSGTKGEGRREPFPARRKRQTNRQSSRPSVATGMSSTIVTGSCWQNCTRGVYISRRIILLRSYRSQETLNQTMERKMCLNTYIRGISFPRTSRAWYPWQDIM